MSTPSTTGFGRFGVHHQQTIATNLKVEPAVARLIYGVMVADRGTLDDLAPADFDREALLALADVEQDPKLAESIAQCVGL